VRLTVLAGSAGTVLPRPGPLLVYNRVAVLLQGLGTSMTCGERSCLPGMFWPLAAAVLRPLGYSSTGRVPSIVEYSYQGGTMERDDGAWIWKPRPYDACDTVQSIAHGVQMLQDMLVSFRDRYPFTTFDVIGHSLGGLVAFEAVGDPGFWQRAGPLAVEKLVTLDSPIDGIDHVHALAWTVDAFAGIWHLYSCSGQDFGAGMVAAISDLSDRAPDLQNGWAAVSTANHAAVLAIANRFDLAVPASSALPDEHSPTGTIDRVRLSLPPTHSLGHSDVLYPTLLADIRNPDWNWLTALLRGYLRQPCLAFAAQAGSCSYPSIDIRV
jgi:pimeloyl-ACP methyl ester carboxylesterase